MTATGRGSWVFRSKSGGWKSLKDLEDLEGFDQLLGTNLKHAGMVVPLGSDWRDTVVGTSVVGT